MHPYLFQGTSHQLVTWSVCNAAGLIVTTILGLFVFNPKDFKLPLIKRLLVLFCFLILGVLGGRITHILLNIKTMSFNKELFYSNILSGPVASLGAYFTNVFTLIVLRNLFLKNVSLLKILDFVVPIFYIMMIFVRIGCFFNGCCVGCYTKLPWGMHFNNSSFLRHPTQLYSVAILVLVLILYWILYRKNYPSGTSFFSSVALYTFLRFFIELLRVDSFNITKVITFSPVFMLSIFLFCITALIINFKLNAKKRYQPTPQIIAINKE